MSEQWQIKDHGVAGQSWLNPNSARLNAVFVHGFHGDHLATWTYTKRRSRIPFLGKSDTVLLMDLLKGDSGLYCNYHSIAHKAGIRSPTDLESASGVIQTFLRNYVEQSSPIVLIAHSFGGLACRLAILSMLKTLADDMPIVGILMMGTPNNGAEIARAAKVLGSSAAGDMRPFDDSLANLNRNWVTHIVNGGDPNINPAERKSLLC